MEFVFVVGGSYKAFYLNRLSKVGNPDIIVFNQNIFYDFDMEKERYFNGPVSVELKQLNKLFNCPIIVYGTIIKDCQKDKCFILCNHGKIKVFDENCDIYIKIKNCYILIGNKQYFLSKTFATITMSNDIKFAKERRHKINNYFYCNKKGVTLFKGGKFYKKFNKCCKFILCFFKKMI